MVKNVEETMQSNILCKFIKKRLLKLCFLLVYDDMLRQLKHKLHSYSMWVDFWLLEWYHFICCHWQQLKFHQTKINTNYLFSLGTYKLLPEMFFSLTFSLCRWPPFHSSTNPSQNYWCHTHTHSDNEFNIIPSHSIFHIEIIH